VISKFLMASELVQDFGSYQFSKRTTWTVQNVYHLSKFTVPTSLIIWIMVAIFEMQVCLSKWFKCADIFFVCVVRMINHNNYTLCLHWHMFVNFLFILFTWSSFWQILWIADGKKESKFQTEYPHYHICMYLKNNCTYL
jgi:hypothetical protein